MGERGNPIFLLVQISVWESSSDFQSLLVEEFTPLT